MRNTKTEQDEYNQRTGYRPAYFQHWPRTYHDRERVDADVMSQRSRLARLVGMMKWLIRKRLTAFEQQFGYDAAYMHHVLNTDLGAFMRFARATGVSRYRKDVPIDLYYAVSIVGALTADCGPCTQLCVTMALRAGVPGVTIAKILRGDDIEMTEPTRLGAQFARAVLARSPAADELREEIVRRHGPRAVITLSLALVASQLYPTFKYALGFGHACQRIDVEGRSIVPKLVAA